MRLSLCPPTRPTPAKIWRVTRNGISSDKRAAKRAGRNIDQIIFVAAESVAAEMVDAVGVKRHVFVKFESSSNACKMTRPARS